MEKGDADLRKPRNIFWSVNRYTINYIRINDRWIDIPSIIRINDFVKTRRELLHLANILPVSFAFFPCVLAHASFWDNSRFKLILSQNKTFWLAILLQETKWKTKDDESKNKNQFYQKLFSVCLQYKMAKLFWKRNKRILLSVCQNL